MLTALKPKRWHNIVVTVLLALMSHEPFEALAMGEPIMSESVMISAMGIIAIFFVWFGYCIAKKNYMKYKEEIDQGDGI
jgi:hypothetical protein